MQSNINRDILDLGMVKKSLGYLAAFLLAGIAYSEEASVEQFAIVCWSSSWDKLEDTHHSLFLLRNRPSPLVNEATIRNTDYFRQETHITIEGDMTEFPDQAKNHQDFLNSPRDFISNLINNGSDATVYEGEVTYAGGTRLFLSNTAGRLPYVTLKFDAAFYSLTRVEYGRQSLVALTCGPEFLVGEDGSWTKVTVPETNN